MRWIACLSLLISLPTSAMTLEEAERAALAHSHEHRELQLERDSARWGEQRALAGFSPRFGLEARHLFAEHFEEVPVEFGGAFFSMPALQPYTSFGLSASWELFSGFETVNQVAASRFAADSATNRLARAEAQLRVSVRTLFYRALGSQILVDVADQNLRTLEGHLSDVNARVRNGVSTRFDALRVEVQIEDARTEKISAENNVVIARARFFESVSVADDGARLEGQLPEDFSNLNLEQAKLDDVRREDRNAQVNELERASRLANAAHSHWMPRVALFGSHEYYNNFNHSVWESDERFNSASLFGVQLKWNLFDGGGSLAAEKQAAIAREVAAERLARFDQKVPVDLEESKRRLSYDVINFKAKQSSVRKAEEAVRLARGGLRAGARTNTEVLDAVVDLNRAKAASVKSQIDAIEALGSLELALGHSLH